MKIKKLITSFALASVMALGVGVGIAASRNEAKGAKAANELYYRGTLNSWGDATGDYIIESGVTRTYDCANADTFKILTSPSEWDTEITSASGTAIDAHSVSFNGTSNSTVNFSSKYFFTNNAGSLYIDIGEFFYVGTDSSWNVLEDSDHPAVTVGSTATLNLTAGEKFKMKNGDRYLGYSDLADGDFYGSFYSDEDGNIVCSIAGSYTLSVSLVNHSSFNVRLYPSGVNPDDTNFVYVLDKYGNKLNTTHKAYTYNSAGQAMGWPGANMTAYAGTTHMYQLEYWVGMETVIFNDGSTKQTIDHPLAGAAGKCLILQETASDYDGTGDNTGKHYWAANTWVDPETAKFVENCMHFQNFAEDDETDGTACKGNEGYYEVAKAAYNALSSDTIRREVCTLDYVVARLQAWALANGKSFIVTDGLGAFSASNVQLTMIGYDTTSTSTFVIVVIASVTLIAVGGFFLLRKKREN
ncbi:MAG: starch-binding protein [Bacilli bacterium]|nr:starch-binding protein [Bacilli bacterium]